MIFVRVLGAIRLVASGLAFFVLRALLPMLKKADRFIFYYILFPLYRLLRIIFHTAETASLSARRKVLCVLAGKQAVSFFLLMTALLVAASNIYAKTGSNEDAPGENLILFSLLGSGEEGFIYEGGSAQDPALLVPDSGAVSYSGGSDQVPDEEDELLPLILGEGAVVQPIISSASPSAAPRIKVETYIVKQGDTPGGIAERFGINLTTLYWANNLSSYSVIRLGQELKIPPVDGLIYTVKKGDTIDKLAKLYRAESSGILSYNRLELQDKLSPGTVIVIPNGKPPPPPPKPAAPRTVIVPAVPNPSSLPGGRFLWPVVSSSSNNGRYITQYFNWRHAGVDIDGDYSNPVIASDGGMVKLVYYGRTGYGFQVVIDHENGILTRYAHLSKILVEQGQRIERGSTVGILGTTGRSTGTHLHYEIFVNGRRINPLSYIR